jgi:hypothetical protein
MADSIRISLSPDRIVVNQGAGPVDCEVVIQNMGTSVDQYAVELDQLPSTWYSLSNVAVALFPQDKEVAKLTIHPPPGNATKAGTYPFTVTALSRADPSQSTRAEGVLQVGAVTSFEMQITPTKLTARRGKYTLNLKNGGNADIQAELTAEDSEDACRFKFKPQTVNLAAGQKTAVRLKVKPRRSNIAGARKYFDFQVKATPSAGPTKSVSAQLIHKPFFLTWRPIRRLFYFLIIFGVIAAATVWFQGNKDKLNGSTACGHVSLFCSNNGGKATPTPIGQISKGKPKFIGAFAHFHKTAPLLVGKPLENESTTGRAATQFTTTGMLIFDRHDGVTYLIRQSDSTVWEYYQGKTLQVR